MLPGREEGLLEIITSRTNERVKQIAALCASAEQRQSAGLCVLHGIKLCREAARLGAPIRELWITEEAESRYPQDAAFLSGCAAGVIRMSQSVCEKLTPQRTPQGMIAVAEMPQTGAVAPQSLHGGRKGRLLVLDEVQDPANVGGALRTAAALGYDGAVLSQGCADPFSPKALRASMGAAFSIPLYGGGSGALLASALRQCGFCTVATALDDRAAPIGSLQRDGALALFIGNEGNGLSAQTVAACDRTVIIPITGLVESLNAAAAAAIAMWELRP